MYSFIHVGLISLIGGIYLTYIACYYVVAMCYISRTGSYRPVYNFPVSQTH